ESAWMPAPPPESVPAMVSARTGVSPRDGRGSSFTAHTIPSCAGSLSDGSSGHRNDKSGCFFYPVPRVIYSGVGHSTITVLQEAFMDMNTPRADVSDNADQNRFELRLNGDLVGILGYYDSDRPSGVPGQGRPVVDFLHTVIVED